MGAVTNSPYVTAPCGGAPNELIVVPTPLLLRVIVVADAGCELIAAEWGILCDEYDSSFNVNGSGVMDEKEAAGAPAPSDNGQRPQATKREYKTPVLVAYGSVRQLTH